MGGFGSGRFGRRTWRETVEASARLNASAIVASAPPSAADRRAGMLVLRVRDDRTGRTQPLQLVASRQPRAGGLRWLVRCPSCGELRRALYLPARASDFRCRECHRLAYVTQRVSPAARLQLRAAKCLARAGGSRDDDVIVKPRGMHWRTFDRLLADAEALDTAAVDIRLGGFLRRRGLIWRPSGGRPNA